MVAKVFDEILLDGIRSGKVPGKQKAARDWFRQRAGEVSKMGPKKLLRKGKERVEPKYWIGHMYHYIYDPKWKKELPYYDTFPLVFPFRRMPGGGFLGTNLHYLPPAWRAKLMDALHDLATNKRYDDTTRVQMSYKKLSQAAKFKAFAPCIKHYLADHVRTGFYKVHPSEWDIALFLPTARFQKSTKEKVWEDSLAIIKKWKVKRPKKTTANTGGTRNKPRSGSKTQARKAARKKRS